MPSYYEILKIDQGATVQEIQLAIDEKYDQCRRLVTHHDPEVVNQANTALQTLEKIRETLLTPVRKSVYDEALGISGNMVGGLMDPQMASAANPSTGMPVKDSPVFGGPAIPQTRPGHQSPSTFVDGWHCTRCNSISQVGSLFCKACGNELGQSCPNCKTTFETVAQFCPACGVRPQQYIEEQEKLRIEAIERERQGIRQKLSEAEAQMQAGMYGLAKDTLGSFEGLGNFSKSVPVICKKNEPEWQRASMVDQNANTMRVAIIKQNTLKIAFGYGIAGVALGVILGVISIIGNASSAIQSESVNFDWSVLLTPFINGLGLGIAGLAAGTIGSAIYFYKWGGRRHANQELIFGAIAPVALAIAAAIGLAFFWLIIVLVIGWFVLMVWLGGG